jgi:tetratricopeptide (TPR) repeat protein/predicted Ser/Thr protein kinase
MDAKRWAVIDSLYHAALAKELGERSSYLAAACAEDPTLRSEVESLLGYADAELSGPIEPSKMAELLDNIGGSATSDRAELVGAAAAGIPTALPAIIGRYRILRLIGEGGMGTVYEAEQEQPRRTVALKVIKPGLASPELLRRFEQESQALGRLQHSGIAQIHEAGTADTGFGPQPYFAMEFIRGQSLLEYAKAYELNTRQRLDLMAKVCEAVHHAHQRGIIHRDLKPGNILVDENGQPKVLDFGVARVTDSDAQATRQTDVGRLVGTLAYMSPEQVLADPLELDTRSDVYALGVILYELLAGRLPYTVSRNLPEAVQTIREEDPARLSSISRNYRGDIETIVAKALEKDKARRYASAAGLAGDIRRYLADEPIVARPPSTSYQLQKFARRHMTLVAGVTAVFVVLVAGVIASTREATRARRAEQVATAESATAKAVNDFLQNDLLAQASARAQARPDTKPDPDLKVRTALDRASARIGNKFEKQPLVEASIRQTIGDTYRDLGLYSEAQRQVEQAIDLRRRVLGKTHRDTLYSMSQLAALYLLQDKYAEAESLDSEVLETQRRTFGEQDPRTIYTMRVLAETHWSLRKFGLAETLYLKALSLSRRVLGEDHRETLAIMSDLGPLYVNERRYVEALSILTKALEIQRRVLGEEHPDTMLTTGNLGTISLYYGKYREAWPLLVKTHEFRSRVFGEEHPDSIMSAGALGTFYLYLGKYKEAESVDTKVLETRRRVLGNEHPFTLGTAILVGQIYANLGRYSDAERLLNGIITITRLRANSKEGRPGDNGPQIQVLRASTALADLYVRQGKTVPAEQMYKGALEMQQRLLGEDHPDSMDTMNHLGQLYQELGNESEAERLLMRTLELRQRVSAPENVFLADVRRALGRLRLEQRRYREAESLLRDALTGFEKAGSENWLRYQTSVLLGASLVAQRRYADAEPFLVSGYQGMLERQSTIPAYERRVLKQAQGWIAQAYANLGRPEKAARIGGKAAVTTSGPRTQ